MPYLRFPTKQEEERAWNIVNNLIGKDKKVTGLVARINTAKYGLVSFFSEVPYMPAIDRIGLSYMLIPKNDISGKVIDALREIHPEYANEL